MPECLGKTKTPRQVARGFLWVFLDLGANVGRSGTLGARLSYKTDLDPGIQPIEIDRAAAMEEVVVAVIGGDKPESALGDELLDGSRHWCGPPFPNVLPRAVEACSSGAHGERTPVGAVWGYPEYKRFKPPPYPPPARGGGKRPVGNGLRGRA